MMKKLSGVILFALLLVGAAAGGAEAQEDWWWGAVYQGSLGSGDTQEMIESFSWRNFGIEGRVLVREDVSMGVFAGWNVFNEQVDEQISFGGADVSGLQARYINAVPLLATVHYYARQSSGRTLFLGGGIGTYWIENRLEMGTTAVTATNWHFGLAPEVGFSFPLDNGLDGFLSVKYNYALEADSIEHSYWTFGIGLGGRR